MKVHSRRVRTILAALAVLLPAGARRLVHRRLLGHEIDRAATVGRAFVDVGSLRMAPGASIGSLTVVRGCDEVDLGPEATIGRLNLVSAVRRGGRYLSGQDRHPALVMERGSAITFFHFVDCSDTVTLGEFTEVGGAGSQILTHTTDLLRVRQVARPVTIGHHCMIGTSSVVLAGTTIPECSIVAPGSVVTPESTGESHRFYSGVPAESKRVLNPRIPYFRREQSDIV